MEDSHQDSLVSIIVPLFNREKLMEDCVHSILNQTHALWELIIVDDGSTDGSYEKALEYGKEDKRIKVIKRNTTPKGAPNCRNIGFMRSEGAYVIFLDSDDLLAPFCLENRVKIFNNYNEFDFLVFPILLFQEKLDDLNKLWNIDDMQEDDILRFLKCDALWQTMGPIYKKSSLAPLHKIFDTDLNYWQDFDLHLRLILENYKYKKFLNLEPDCFHRVHTSSISNSGTFNEKVIKSRYLVVQKVWKLLKTKSLNSQAARTNLKSIVFFKILIEAIYNKKYLFSYNVLWHLKKLGLLTYMEIFKFKVLICYNIVKFEKDKKWFYSLVSFLFKSYLIEGKIGKIDYKK